MTRQKSHPVKKTLKTVTSEHDTKPGTSDQAKPGDYDTNKNPNWTQKRCPVRKSDPKGTQHAYSGERDHAFRRIVIMDSE
ncbi:hypothetical protein LGM69_25250 [Burkholderia multivorans]|nr:hypothetical protein [Burkholderia multivorans]